MKIFLLISALFALALPALAEDTGLIQATDAKARPTAPGISMGVVYLQLKNHGDTDDTLTGMSTPIAAKAELHRTTEAGGVMKMDSVPNLPIKANGDATLAPGGLHIMLIGLKQQLKLGDNFPLTLDFAKAGSITVTATVAPINVPSKPMSDMPGMKM